MTVHMVDVGGTQLDLRGALQRAKGSDWAALIEYNGWNPFTVQQGINALATVGADDAMDVLAGPAGGKLVLTICCLVFLARRDAGVQITPGESFDTTDVMSVLAGFMDASRRAAAEEAPAAVDPTQARTATVPGTNLV